MKIEIHIAGDASAELRTSARNFMRGLTDEDIEETCLQSSDEAEKAVDPMALATLILAVPGALLALDQLSDRLERFDERKDIKDRIEPLISAPYEQKKNITLIIGDEVIPLGERNADQVLDALRRAGIKAGKPQ